MTNQRADHLFTFKPKQPHNMLEEALTHSQGRTKALLRALSDEAIVELHDVLDHFVPAAQKRVHERETKRLKLIHYKELIRSEFRDDLDWAISNLTVMCGKRNKAKK